MTWDFARDAEVDAKAVGAYVKDAVAKHAHFKANAKEITAAAKRR